MTSKEVLKAKRHQLYCSIADACQQTNLDSSDILGRLQAVLEAEACLSCMDGDAEAEQNALEAPNSHASGFLGAAAPVQHRVERAPGSAGPCGPFAGPVRLTARTATSALHELKEELAQRAHQSVQHQLQQNPRHGKFMSCSALLADLRAAQKATADLEDQLEAAQVAAARQKQRCEHDVRAYKKAADQATRLAEAANNRLVELEQRLNQQSREAADQTQQLAEQANCTVKLGAELRQVKHQMMQLHASVLQPLLRWQQEHGAEHSDTAGAITDSSHSKRHSHKRWRLPSAVTPEAIKSAAAAVEVLLQQQAEHTQELKTVQQEQLLHRDKRLQTLLDRVERAEAGLQEKHGQLEAALQEASTYHQRVQQLQQQLTARSFEHAHEEQRHSDEVAAAAEQATAAAAADAQVQLRAQQQQLDELQQQVNRLLSELACAQGEAAAAQRQVARLQQEQQQASLEAEERLQQLQQAADARVAQQVAAARAQAEQEVQQQHVQAQATVQQEAQQALEQEKHGWQEQRAALEKQHLQALLRSRQALEEARQQWQKERDELVQQLTAQHTASGMQAQLAAKEQMDRLQQQLQRLQQDHDALQQQLHTGTRQPPAGPCATYQQLQHASGCDPPHLAQLPAAQGLVWSRGTSNVSTNRLHAGLRHSMQQPNSSTALGDGGSEPAAFAVQFSRALQAADADRTAAVRRAVAAEQEAAELRRHLTQQEQEILHLHRALDELRSACSAATKAAEEAEASASASSSALQEQVAQVQQLQTRLDEAGERHQYELRALRQSMAEQIRVLQSDARAELEAAQTRLQLVRLKQQRMAASLMTTAVEKQ